MFQRGTVTKITFEIEYPDGSTKVSTVSPETARSLSRIVFREEFIEAADIPQFNVSETDHTKNPTMILYADRNGEAIVQPFCGNNGTVPCEM